MATERDDVSGGNDAGQVLADRWNAASSLERLALLGGFDKASIPLLAVQAPAWLAGEIDLAVSVRLIRMFGPHWPATGLDVLAKRLQSRRLLESLAALEVLIQRDPARLRDDLPQLLMSTDAGARALAVKGLARIDEHAAVEHFEAMLASPVAELRHQALKVAVVLPFDRAKPALCAFLAVERDPALFDEALSVFEINPDPEVPYRLFELAETVVGPLQERLVAAVRQSCATLRASGLLAGGFDAAMAQLQTWIRERRAARFVRQCVARLLDTDLGPIDVDLIAEVRQALTQGEIRTCFEKALASKLPEPLLRALRELVQVAEAPSVTVLPPVGAAAVSPVVANAPTPPVTRPTPADEVRAIAELALVAEPEVSVGVQEQLRGALRADRPDLAATALRTALRLHEGSFVAVAEPLLQHDNEAVVAAAIKYLACFGPDLLFPRLGRFLASPSRRTKGAALEALRDSDPTQAVSRLRQLLFDPQRRHQELALGCLVQFPFPLVRQLLAEYLRVRAESELFATGLAIFAAFPDSENLDLLFDIARARRDEQAQSVERILADTEARLVELGLITHDALPMLRSKREQRWQELEQRRRAPPPRYSVQALGRDRAPGLGEICRALWARLSWRLAGVAVVSGVLVAGALGWAMQTPGEAAVVTRARALPQQEVDLAGTLVGCEGEPEERCSTLRLDDGTVWRLLEQGSSRAALFAVGARIRVRAVPFRVDGNGTILAYLVDCRAAEK